MLRCIGHVDVRILDGSYSHWLDRGYPVEQGSNRPSPGDIQGQYQESMISTLSDIEAHVSGGVEGHLIDARDAQRFAGKVEPIDPVAGHVPGALNMPFNQALDESGLWRNSESLHEDWVKLTGEEQGCTVMCGSGVTACHLAISAELAGRLLPRVYVGSWSEWIRNPDRPVAGKQAP